MTHGDIVMEKVTNLGVNDLLDLIAKLDPKLIAESYPQIVAALQARMTSEQAPFE